MEEKIVLQWSGGKDSALALYELIHDEAYHVCGLLTTFTEAYDRVSMHGVRRDLLLAQAGAMSQKIIPLCVPAGVTNEEYEQSVSNVLLKLKDQGIHKVATGDIFLQGIRRYREENLKKVGMELVTPLWGNHSKQLIQRFLDLGFKAVTVCVCGQYLGEAYVGREIDERFIGSLPQGVDPGGERGEFHSFVYDGPLFTRAISLKWGETILREGHYFRELMGQLKGYERRHRPQSNARRVPGGQHKRWVGARSIRGWTMSKVGMSCCS